MKLYYHVIDIETGTTVYPLGSQRGDSESGSCVAWGEGGTCYGKGDSPRAAKALAERWRDYFIRRGYRYQRA